MPTKVLLVNLDTPEVAASPNVFLTKTTIGKEPTLHDYDVVVIDTDELLNIDRYHNYSAPDAYRLEYKSEEVKKRYLEQVSTGGLIFCFAGVSRSISLNYGSGPTRSSYDVNSYCWLPTEISRTNESGDTTRITHEENLSYRELVKIVLGKGAKWTCYFSSLPPGSRTIATNRAGYPIFVEVPIGRGKLVLLPRFDDQVLALKAIIEKIIPRLVGEEVSLQRPAWLSEFKFTFEDTLRVKLSEVEMAKRLLYTKDKELKKAVIWAFKELGLSAEEKPDGTQPDLEISEGSFLAKVEVKGHDNDLGSRPDVLQVLGYMSEEKKSKGIVVCNHQTLLHPAKRNLVAFTPAAIDLAKKNDIGLLSSLDLFTLVAAQIEGKLDAQALEEIKSSLTRGSGVLNLSQKLTLSP